MPPSGIGASGIGAAVVQGLEEDGARGEVFGEGPECVRFGGEGLDVGVGHRARRLPPEAPGGLDVARGHKAGDHAL